MKDARGEIPQCWAVGKGDGLLPEIRLTRTPGRDADKTTPAAKWLLADAEFRNDGFVALGIVFLEVVEQATPLADQHEKTAARAVVFLVRLEVLRQLANTFAEQRDLNFGTAGVGRVRAMQVNDGSFLLSG